MNDAGKVAALHRVPLFSGVDVRDLERIARTTVERHYAAGAEIVSEGDRGVAMYIVVEGRAEATKAGTEGVLAEFGPGAYFGELALFDSSPRNATIRAVSAVDCLALVEWDFKALLRTEPSIALQLLAVTVRRLRATTARLVEVDDAAAVDHAE